MIFSEQAEQAVLGSLIINPNAYHDIAGFLAPTDFFIVRHQWIYEAIVSLINERMAVDTLTISERLKQHDRLTDTGGGAYLALIANAVPTSVNIEAYAHIVSRSAARRRLQGAAAEIAAIASNEEHATPEILDIAQKIILDVTRPPDDGRLLTMERAAQDHYDLTSDRYLHGTDSGIKCGFTDLDAMTDGFQNSDLIILAGRPGMGKTALMLNMAINIAKRGGGVGFFSLEMATEQLVNRIMAGEMNINSQKLRVPNTLSETEYAQYVTTNAQLATWNMMIDDTPGATMQYVYSMTRRMVHEGIKILFVDYLTLIRTAGFSRDNRVQEVGYIARELKNLAREFNIPVVVGAQLHRGVEQRQEKRPIISDLRESGEIEQEADIVAMLYRHAYYHDDYENPCEAELNIVKHRNGGTGRLYLHFKHEFAQFRTAIRVTHDISGMV